MWSMNVSDVVVYTLWQDVDIMAKRRFCLVSAPALDFPPPNSRFCARLQQICLNLWWFVILIYRWVPLNSKLIHFELTNFELSEQNNT